MFFVCAELLFFFFFLFHSSKNHWYAQNKNYNFMTKKINVLVCFHLPANKYLIEIHTRDLPMDANSATEHAV